MNNFDEILGELKELFSTKTSWGKNQICDLLEDYFEQKAYEIKVAETPPPVPSRSRSKRKNRIAQTSKIPFLSIPPAKTNPQSPAEIKKSLGVKRNSRHPNAEFELKTQAETILQPATVICQDKSHSSKGQVLLKEFLKYRFPKATIYENHKPKFLQGLEIDFLVVTDESVLGFEFNGDQHYYDTEKFGPCDHLKSNDSKKANLFKSNNIPLFIIEATDLQSSRLNELLKDFPQEIPGFNRSYEILLREKFSELNKYASDYRKFLISNFNSPTAFERDSSYRKDFEKSLASKTGISLAEAPWD